MASELMPGWMRGIAGFNPLDWAVRVGRSAMSANPDWGLVAGPGGLLAALAVAAVALSTRTFRAYQKAV
jgi:ABC-2 type transport system permease protein